jgi:hypothetical protein
MSLRALAYVPSEQFQHPLSVAYVPTWHAEHVCAPPSSSSVNPCDTSQTQLEEVICPGSTVMPTVEDKKSTHDVQAVECGASLYACSGQSSHATLQLADFNFPGVQAVHGPQSGPLKPGSKRQSTRHPLWAREKEWSGHSLQSSVSSSLSAASSLYVPPAQTRHSYALSSAKPALQRQASCVTEACGERALGSQTSQVVCPWLGWKVSAGHGVHACVTRLSSACVYPVTMMMPFYRNKNDTLAVDPALGRIRGAEQRGDEAGRARRCAEL